MKIILIIPLLIITFLLNGCPGHTHDDDPAGPDGWLSGDTHEKFDKLAAQLGGFSATMKEVGYRYVELYWAGADGNWEYAAYQADKIGSAIVDGIERRPGRAESAMRFLNTDLPAMEDAIADRDRDTFMEAFNTFTRSCNTCHIAEDVPFIPIEEPEERLSPVRWND